MNFCKNCIRKFSVRISVYGLRCGNRSIRRDGQRRTRCETREGDCGDHESVKYEWPSTTESSLPSFYYLFYYLLV